MNYPQITQHRYGQMEAPYPYESSHEVKIKFTHRHGKHGTHRDAGVSMMYTGTKVAFADTVG